MGKSIGILDIGSGFYKMLIFEKDEDGFPNFYWDKVVPSKGIEYGTIVRSSLARRSLKELIKLLKKADINVDELNVLISHPKIKFNNIRVEYKKNDFEDLIEIQDDQLKELESQAKRKVEEKGYEIIHIIPRFYLLDGEKYFEPVGLTATKLEAEYHVIKIPKTVAKNIRNLLTRIDFGGGTIRNILFPPYVASFDIFDEEDLEKDILIIDLGHTTTGYILFKEGAPLVSGVIPLGGKHITEVLADKFFLSFNEAENLKKQIGLLGYIEENPGGEEPQTLPVRNKENKLVHIEVDNVVQKIEDALLEIVEELFKQLIEIHKIAIEREIEEIVLIGGGAQLKGIKPFFEGIRERLEVPWKIRIGTTIHDDLFEEIGRLEGIGETSEEEKDSTKLEEGKLLSPQFAALRGGAWYLIIQREIDESQLILEKEENQSIPTGLQPAIPRGDTSFDEKKDNLFKRLVQFIKKVFSDE